MALVIDGSQLTAVVAAIASAGLTALTYSIKYGRKLSPLLKMLVEFRRDWQGEPERPGYPARPGMAERTLLLERRQQAILAELQANGGGSLRDAVRRIEQAQRATAVTIGAPILPLPPAEVRQLAESGHLIELERRQQEAQSPQHQPAA
jgi:hypothetical protein